MNDSLNEDVAPDQNQPRPLNEMSVLAPLLTIFTAGYMGLMAADFLLGEQLNVPAGLMPVYMGILGAYAADKEIRRWAGRPEPPRKGSVFVYLWCLFYLLAFVAYVFRPEYKLPEELLPVTLRVLGIFFGSKASRYIHEGYSAKTAEISDERLAAVMTLFNDREAISRKDVMARLKVSSSTATRLLEELSGRGKLRLQGAGRGAVYVRN